jgi:hypothetical protein
MSLPCFRNLVVRVCFGVCVPGGLLSQTPTQVIVPKPSARELSRTNHHVANSARTPAPEPGQENTPIPSPLVRLDGQRVKDASEWYRTRRPELVGLWTRVLGKTEPNQADRKWFGDVTKVQIKDVQEKSRYTRIDLDIPIETDFFQHHLLLIPKDQGPGPFPAVIAWAASSSDYRQPESWWGEYLSSNGYVVLTSWSLMRNYRNGTTSRTGATDLLHERFAHWLPIARMAYDVRREAEYLKSRPEVDGSRIGFIGFSHSAKAAVYVGAFAPEIKAIISLDPHIGVNGGTNYYDPWYLAWRRKFDDINTGDYPVADLRGTVQSLLNPDPDRPGFERDHHELLSMAAPRPFLLIGGSQSENSGRDSDDLQSWGYFNRAKEVYELLGIGERLQFASTNDGHAPNGPNIDTAWKTFFQRWLKDTPIEFSGWTGRYGPAVSR